MKRRRPVPDPTISLSPSGGILVEIHSVLAEGRSHHVEVPLTLGGLSILKKILIDRQRAAAKEPPTIGSMGSPTAWQIAKFLQDKDREDRAAAREATKSLVQKIGLDDIELEL